MLQLRQADDTHRAFIADTHEFASGMPLHGHRRDILTLLLESERCAIRSWIEICDMTFGKDPRTYDMASRILNEEIEHEAWFIELLARERDGKTIRSGHFRRGAPGEAPYSKNAHFYNP